MAVVDKQGNIISIVRNHECSFGEGPLMTIQGGGTYGTGDIAGGNTNILFDISSGEFVSSYGSLVGAIRPCAGGPTPWGSWLSAEENFSVDQFGFEHGWLFDVPGFGISDGVPIKAAGRFNHEAAAVDPQTGGKLISEAMVLTKCYQ